MAFLALAKHPALGLKTAVKMMLAAAKARRRRPAMLDGFVDSMVSGTVRGVSIEASGPAVYMAAYPRGVALLACRSIFNPSAMGSVLNGLGMTASLTMLLRPM